MGRIVCVFCKISAEPNIIRILSHAIRVSAVRHVRCWNESGVDSTPARVPGNVDFCNHGPRNWSLRNATSVGRKVRRRGTNRTCNIDVIPVHQNRPKTAAVSIGDKCCCCCTVGIVFSKASQSSRVNFSTVRGDNKAHAGVS